MFLLLNIFEVWVFANIIYLLSWRISPLVSWGDILKSWVGTGFFQYCFCIYWFDSVTLLVLLSETMGTWIDSWMLKSLNTWNKLHLVMEYNKALCVIAFDSILWGVCVQITIYTYYAYLYVNINRQDTCTFLFLKTIFISIQGIRLQNGIFKQNLVCCIFSSRFSPNPLQPHAPPIHVASFLLSYITRAFF